MAGDSLELVKLRNDFYRDNYRRVIGILFFTVFIIIGLAVALIYEVTNPPPPQYFATDAEGRIIHLYPLDEPNLSQGALLQWANVAAVAVFSYDFVNYRENLQDASEFFTPDGWQNFMNALQDNDNLNAVLTKKLVVSAVATAAPVILQEGVLQGRYSWRVQMPMLVTYQSASQVTQQNLTVTMLITRISTLNSEKGIGIAQFVATTNSTVQ